MKTRITGQAVSIYHSVLTRRQRQINFYASTPLNATKIAVMNVSDVEVVRVGPELLFSIYKCCFLAFWREGGREGGERREGVSE